MDYQVSVTMSFELQWQVIPLSGYLMTLALTDEKEKV